MELQDMDTPKEVAVSLVLVVGGIGHGKSSFINSVFGEEKCKVGSTWGVGKTITKDIQEIDYKRKDDIITFVDTPSLDALNSSSKFQNLYKTGFNALVIVCSIKSYPSQSSSLFDNIKSLFGEDLYRYSLVVLSFEDYLSESTVDEFLNANSTLKAFLKKTEDKYVAFDNTLDKESKEANEQRARFFVYLDSVLRNNEDQTLKQIGRCSLLCSCCCKCWSWCKCKLHLNS